MIIFILFVKIINNALRNDTFPWSSPVKGSDGMASLLGRVLNQGFNQGDLNIVDELFSADSVTHTDRWGMPANRTGWKLFIIALRQGFPDLRCVLEHEIKTGDWFAARWILTGTHQGVFMGNAPTGRPIEIAGMIFARVKNGQIAEDWTLIDQMGILQQLRLIPPITS